MKSAPLSLVSSLYHETASSSLTSQQPTILFETKEAFVVYLLTYIILMRKVEEQE